MANPNAAEDGKKGGRPKGSKDKLTRDVKQRIIDVWNKLEEGGAISPRMRSRRPAMVLR